MSLFIVPGETAGIEIIRNVAVEGESGKHGSHGYVRYNDVPSAGRPCAAAVKASAFMIAQTRLAAGPDPPCDAHNCAGAQGFRHDV